MSIPPLFLQLSPLLLILLVPSLMLQHHPGNLLINYVLARPCHHLGDADVAHMRDDTERRDHPQVAHVDALAVEGHLEALAVDRHYHQAVEHAHQVGDDSGAEVASGLVQIHLVVLVIFRLGVFRDMVTQVFTGVGFQGPLVGTDEFRPQMAVTAWILTLVLVEGENF